jgi:serine/threonine protein kinase
MSKIQERVRSLSRSQRSVYELHAERFEESWASSPASEPDLASFLVEDEPIRTLLLVHLVKCDIEFRRQAGNIRLPEEYIARFPELGSNLVAAVEVLLWEYRRGETRLEELVGRFPDLADELRGAAQQLAHPKAWTPPADYEMELQPIGVGGWGEVYKARHKRRDRIEALKVVKTHFRNESEADKVRDRVDRLRQEIPAAAKANHPNIVQLYWDGECDGRLYFAMEYCSGGSLRQKLDGGPLPPREAAELVCILARALTAVHAFGLVHRDLKPDNILFGDKNVPKIADFGLALPIARPGHESEGIVGTPAYMAPEQIDLARGQTGPEADIYGLGAVLYHCITGRAPFTGSIETVLLDSLRTEPTAPRALNPKVSRDLDAICRKCLEKDPKKRYPTTTALAEELTRFLHGAPVKSRRQPLVRNVWFWIRTNPRKSVWAAAILLMLVSASTILKIQSDRRAAELQLSNKLRVKAEEAAESERARVIVELRRAHEVHVNAARELARRGDWLSALEEFDKAIAEQQTDSLRLRVERLPGFFAINDTKQLESELSDLKKMDLQELAAQVKLLEGAWLLCDSDRQAEGQRLVQESLRDRHLLFSKADEHFGEAIVASGIGGTIASLKKAVQADPFHFLAGTSLAMTLAAVGDRTESRRQTQLLRSIYPVSPVPDFAEALLAFIECDRLQLSHALANVKQRIPEGRRARLARTERSLGILMELQEISIRSSAADGWKSLEEFPRALELVAILKKEGALPNLEPFALPVPTFAVISQRWLHIFTIYTDIGMKAQTGLVAESMLEPLRKMNSDYPDTVCLLLEALISLQLTIAPINQNDLAECRKRIDTAVSASNQAIHTPCILSKSSIPFLAAGVSAVSDLLLLRLYRDPGPNRLANARDRLHLVVQSGRDWRPKRQQLAELLVKVACVPLPSEPKVGWDFDDFKGREAYAKRRSEVFALARFMLDDWALDEPGNVQISKFRKELETSAASSGILETTKKSK